MPQRKRSRARSNGMWKGIGITLVTLVILGTVLMMTGVFSVGEDKKADFGNQTPPLSELQNLGDAATLTLNSFTGTWGDQGAETEVYPTYTVVLKDGTKIVNDAVANSTTDVVVGSTVNVYGTGATYYLDSVEKTVSIAKDTASIKGYSAVATTDLVITVYDSDEVALTADDNSNNTADYAGGDIAASANEIYYVKLKQTGANLNLQLGAMCTWVLGDEADDLEIASDQPFIADGLAFKEVGVPDTIDDTTITMYDDGNASTAEKGFKHCYVVTGGSHLLKENMDTGKIKLVFDSDDTTQPSANGDSYFGLVFLDASYSVDKNGNIKFGFFMDDDTEDPGTVGIDENPDTTWNGLDTAVTVEPQ